MSLAELKIGSFSFSLVCPNQSGSCSKNRVNQIFILLKNGAFIFLGKRAFQFSGSFFLALYTVLILISFFFQPSLVNLPPVNPTSHTRSFSLWWLKPKFPILILPSLLPYFFTSSREDVREAQRPRGNLHPVGSCSSVSCLFVLTQLNYGNFTGAFLFFQSFRPSYWTGEAGSEPGPSSGKACGGAGHHQGRSCSCRRCRRPCWARRGSGSGWSCRACRVLAGAICHLYQLDHAPYVVMVPSRWTCVPVSYS